MKVTSDFATFKKCWPNSVSSGAPFLYVLDQQNHVTSAFPVAGQIYEWIMVDKPSEDDFLAVYGYAHSVSSVQP